MFYPILERTASKPFHKYTPANKERVQPLWGHKEAERPYMLNLEIICIMSDQREITVKSQ